MRLDARSLRRQLLLSSTVLVGALGAYGRRAYAACVPVGGSSFQCSGANATTQTINAANASVTTLPGFSVTTVISNGITITGDGALSYTDANNSSISSTAATFSGLAIGSLASGTDSVTVTATGSIAGTSAGIFARNNYGGGAMSITANGNITGTNAGSRGVFAQNRGTDLIVITGAAVTGLSYGIFARNYGTGATTVTANGNVTATTQSGIFARNAGTSLTVTTGAGSLVSGRYGIFVRNDGSGALTITTSGDVTGNSEDGIYARNSTGGPIAITVNAGSDVTSNGGGLDDFAIDTSSFFVSATSLTVAGTLDGGGGGAIRFQSAADRLELQPGAVISGTVLAGTGTDTFVLGGTGTATFDVASIGAGLQYQNFETFLKEDGSTWTLTGTNTTIDNFAVNGGLLTVSGSMPNTPFTVNAATLELTGTGNVGSVNIADAAGVFDISATTAGATITTLSGVAGSSVALGAETLTLSNASGTFNGVIGGTGGLVLDGGTETLTGTSTYTGATTINGRLLVDGSIASSSGLTVNAGGTVGGTGTLPSTLISGGGTLAPGNPLGSINVLGNLTFFSASTYVVDISPTDSDRTNVTGTATLAGTVHVDPQAGSYPRNTSYTILTAAGGLSGTFSALDIGSAFLCACLSYDANNVYLTITSTGLTFAGVGRTPNQIATGAAVERLGTGNPIYDVVVLGSAEEARTAFDLLSGEVHASAVSAMLEDSRYVRDSIFGRLRQASYGDAADLSAVALSAGGPATVASLPVGRMALGASTESLPGGGPDDALVFWSHVFGSWLSLSSDGNAASAKQDLGGFVSGMDAALGGDWRAGLATGYSRANLDVDARVSTAAVDNYYLAAYAGGRLGAFGLRGGIAHTWSGIETSRGVAFSSGEGCCVSTFSDIVQAGYQARTVQAFGEASFGLSAGGAAIEPFANAAFVDVHRGAFTETGGAAALAASGVGTDVTFSALGVRAATSLRGVDALLTPHVSLAWQHAFGDVTPDVALAFAGNGAGFTVAGVPLARDSALVQAGLDFRIARDATLGVSYSGQLADDVQDHGITGRLDWRF